MPHLRCRGEILHHRGDLQCGGQEDRIFILGDRVYQSRLWLLLLDSRSSAPYHRLRDCQEGSCRKVESSCRSQRERKPVISPRRSRIWCGREMVASASSADRIKRCQTAISSEDPKVDWEFPRISSVCVSGVTRCMTKAQTAGRLKRIPNDI